MSDRFCIDFEIPKKFQKAADCIALARDKYDGQEWDNAPNKRKHADQVLNCIGNFASGRTKDAMDVTVKYSLCRVADLAARYGDAEDRSKVFEDAIRQAYNGKGLERHRNTDDPCLFKIERRLGSGTYWFCIGQALKKVDEAVGKPDNLAYAELLGAINYLSFAGMLLR